MESFFALNFNDVTMCQTVSLSIDYGVSSVNMLFTETPQKSVTELTMSDNGWKDFSAAICVSIVS